MCSLFIVRDFIEVSEINAHVEGSDSEPSGIELRVLMLLVVHCVGGSNLLPVLFILDKAQVYSDEVSV